MTRERLTGCVFSFNNVKLRTEANDTHARYGSCIYPATGSTREKAPMRTITRAQSAPMSNSAKAMSCFRKKMGFQNRLMISWRTHKDRVSF